MPASATDVPPEIWCHICQYIPPSDWPNVALVNRSLYGIIISDLYHHVEVVSRNPSLFTHAFQTLDREQELTRRLKKLTLWIHALNEVIHLEDPTAASEPAIDPPTRKLAKSSPLPWNRNRTYSLRDLIPTHRKEVSPLPPVMDKRALFLGVLSKLQELRDLVLVWQLDVGYNRSSSTTCSQLVNEAWVRAAHNLRSLTLDMAMFNLYETLRTPPELKTLEELHIRITLEKHGAFRGNAARILSNTVVPFINGLAAQLKLFSFTSLCNLNLDPLFQDMNPTPQLRHLILCFGFQSHEMWNPNTLQTFLREHNTIEELDLRYGECCISPFPHDWIFHDSVLVGPSFTGSNTVTFPNLEFVTLGLQFVLSEEHLLGQYASRFSGPSVSSLTLLGRSLPFTQIKVILIPFQKSLKSLRMFVKVLTPELLCLIANLLPLLQELTLHVQSYSSSHRRGREGPQTKDDFLRGMRSGLGRDTLSKLNQWQLLRIHVREFAYAKGDVPAWDVMQAIGAVVPSITSWDV